VSAGCQGRKKKQERKKRVGFAVKKGKAVVAAIESPMGI
jgi:hypothetical protein